MLTAKQEKILNIINEYTSLNGFAPTVREICSLAGLKAPSTVHQHIKLLKEKGYLKNSERKSRTLSSTKEEGYVSVPLIGTITAGEPILAYENIEGYYPLPLSMSKGRELFMLKVSGDSMINAGINDNDLVIVKKQNSANNRDIVVALIEDSATVKRLVKENEETYLMPENPVYQPIHTDKLKILGIVVGLFREF